MFDAGEILRILSKLRLFLILLILLMPMVLFTVPVDAVELNEETFQATRGASSLVLERPRLALPAIRTPGESFEVWIRGEGIENSSYFNITIIGEGETYSLKISKLIKEDDRWILSLRLANDTLVDFYDISVIVDAQEQYQQNAVNVIKEYKNPFKFVHITDIHVDDKNSVANFQAAVREINLINPELVFITGDSYDADPTGSGTPDQDQADMFINICKGFRVPVYVITGNHEYSYRNAEGINIYSNTINPLLDYTFNYGKHHFIGLNCGHWQRSPIPSIPHPDNKVESFTDQQMEWITNDLTKHTNDSMKLIFMHAPLKTNNGRDTPMWHVEDMENLMIENDVKAFIAGHTHRDEIIDVNDNVLEGDWQAPDYPLVIQTASGGSEDTVEECSYRVFKVDNDTFDYYTYDHDGDGVRNSVASTPMGRIKVEISKPNDGTRVSSEFTVTNDQYEDLEDGRVILKMATPPEGMNYCVNDGEVINVVDTLDGQNVHIQVSVSGISQKTFSVFQLDITAPDIIEVYSKSGNNISGVYERGNEVEIIVQEGNLETGLMGSISIRNDEDHPLIENAPLMDSGGGRYTYFWDTTNVPANKSYWLEAFLEDGAGNFDRTPEFDTAHNITIVDTIPPEINRVRSKMNGDDDNTYSIGSVIRIIVEEANDEMGLDGKVFITLSENQSLFNGTFPLDEEGDGNYHFKWDTAGLPYGKYLIETLLIDEWGNRDDGLWPSVDLVIHLIDDFPPVVASVGSLVEVDELVDDDAEYPLGGSVHFLVRESSDEESLSGELIISREDDRTTVAVLPLEGIPGKPGSYGAEWNSYGAEVGVFHVDSKLWDSSGNMDSDGAPEEPDHTFTLVDQDMPRILDTVPEDSAENVPISPKITLRFSEPIISDRLQIAVRIEDLYFNEIPFHVEWFEMNATAILVPDHVLSYHSTYVLILTDKIMDKAGNRIDGEKLIRFTTIPYQPKENVDGRYTMFPPQRKLLLESDDLTKFSIQLMSKEILELPVHYSWYLNGQELHNGPNASQYILNAANLSTENSYELEVRVTGESIEISDYWILQVRNDDDDDGEASQGNTYGSAALKWAYGAGIIVVCLGFFLIIFYLNIRRRRHNKMLEDELRFHISNVNEDKMDNGKQKGRNELNSYEKPLFLEKKAAQKNRLDGLYFLNDERKETRSEGKRKRTLKDRSKGLKRKRTSGKSKRKRKSLTLSGETPFVEILPPVSAWPSSNAGLPYQPRTHIETDIIDIEPLLKQDDEITVVSGENNNDSSENLRDIVEDFIRGIDK